MTVQDATWDKQRIGLGITGNVRGGFAIASVTASAPRVGKAAKHF